MSFCLQILLPYCRVTLEYCREYYDESNNHNVCVTERRNAYSYIKVML